MSSLEMRSKVLALYRAILRAATYLPDLKARAHVYSLSRHRIQSTNDFTTSRLKNAEQTIRTLQRAAVGDPSSLKYVLAHTYGATGPKRRELLDRFRALSGNDTAQDALIIPSTHTSTKPSKPPKTIMQTFLESQMKQAPDDALRSKLRRIEPVVPATNIWGRSLPKVRVKNIQHRFWKNTYDKLLPPLPLRDWNHLRDLATGVTKLDPIPKTRTNADTKIFDFMLDSSITQPIRSVERTGAHECHNLTPRYRRRLYSLIWNNVSKLQPSSDGRDKVIVTWGQPRTPVSRQIYPQARQQDMELFDKL